MELMMIAMEQEPDRGYVVDSNGYYYLPISIERPIRRTRFSVIA
jgi:hypothetical protein